MNVEESVRIQLQTIHRHAQYKAGPENEQNLFIHNRTQMVPISAFYVINIWMGVNVLVTNSIPTCFTSTIKVFVYSEFKIFLCIPQSSIVTYMFKSDSAQFFNSYLK